MDDTTRRLLSLQCYDIFLSSTIFGDSVDSTISDRYWTRSPVTDSEAFGSGQDTGLTDRHLNLTRDLQVGSYKRFQGGPRLFD